MMGFKMNDDDFKYLQQRISMLFSLTFRLHNMTEEIWEKSRRLKNPDKRGNVVLDTNDKNFVDHFMKFSTKQEIFNNILGNVYRNGIQFYSRDDLDQSGFFDNKG